MVGYQFSLQLVNYNLYVDSTLKFAAFSGIIGGLFVISWILPSYMVRYQYCCPDINDAVKDMEIDKFLLLNDGLRPGKKSRDEEVPDRQRRERIEIAKRDIDGFELVLCMKRERNEDYPDYSQRLICRLGKTEKNIDKVFYILRHGPNVLQFWTVE